LVEQGVSEAQIEKMMLANPARLLEASTLG
jgi:predicted metal-dependent phosphotriesterase family hydrolase